MSTEPQLGPTRDSKQVRPTREILREILTSCRALQGKTFDLEEKKCDAPSGVGDHLISFAGSGVNDRLKIRARDGKQWMEFYVNVRGGHPVEVLGNQFREIARAGGYMAPAMTSAPAERRPGRRPKIERRYDPDAAAADRAAQGAARFTVVKRGESSAPRPAPLPTATSALKPDIPGGGEAQDHVGDTLKGINPTFEDLGPKEWVELSRIRANPNQPRPENSPGFDEESLRGLGENMNAMGQLQAALVRPLRDEAHEFEIIEGERRFRACGLVGRAKLLCIIVERELSPDEVFDLSAAANCCRVDFDGLEKARIIWKMRNRENPRSMKDIAIILGCSKASAWQYYGLRRLAPQVLARLEPDALPGEKIVFAAAIEIAANFPDDQESQIEIARDIAHRELKSEAAKAFIRAKATHLGREREGSGTKPYRQRTRFKSWIDRFKTETGIWMDYTRSQLEAMFLEKPELLKHTLKRLDETIDQLSALREVLKSIVEGRRAK